MIDLTEERAEIRIAPGAGDDDVAAVDFHGLAQPAAGFLELPELAGVAGEVVGDHTEGREPADGGQQGIPGFGGPAEFVEGEGAVDPAGGAGVVGFLEAGGDVERLGPAPFAGVELPFDGERLGVGAEGGAEAGDFLPGIARQAQLKPADRGVEVVGVWGLDVRHCGAGWVLR